MAERTTELTRDIDATRERMSGTIDAIEDRVVPSRVANRRWQQARGSATRLRTRVMGAPRSAGSSMSERASGAGSSLGDAASSAKDQLTSTPQRIEERTQGNPLAAGAIAFGIGVLIGSAAPPSQEEQQLAEQVTPMLKDEAQAIAHEVADTAKSEAQDHLQQVKGEASDSAERVKAKAQEAADTTKDHASEATGQVSSTARSGVDDVRSDEPRSPGVG
jgi:ElaB/YqjD/DUF883 family membrane-anchored ribosome-binding protein